MFRKKKEKLAPRQFYVQFLGWLPSTGVQGTNYTSSAIYELKQKLKQYPNLPKLTLKINDEGIEVSPMSDDSKKKTMNPKVFPIKLEDVMFVSLERMESDIAACIFCNRKAKKPQYLQIHVYRFDSSTTALLFVQNLQMMTTTEAHLLHVRRIEERERQQNMGPQLQKSPLIAVSSGVSSINATVDENVPVIPDDPQVQAITDELKQKFTTKGPPILLPAKDYDTVRRKQGHIDKMGTRKCRNEKVIGSFRSHFDGDDDDDDDDDEDSSSNQKSPYPFYPAKKSPDRTPHSPEIAHVMDRRYQRPSSAYGSNSDLRKGNSPSPILTSQQSPQLFDAQKGVFRYDRQHHERPESLKSTGSSDSSITLRHSPSMRSPLPTMSKPNLEIPPDYDTSQRAPRYQVQRQPHQPMQGYYRDDLLIHNHNRAYPSVQNERWSYHSSMNLAEVHAQHRSDPSELFGKQFR